MSIICSSNELSNRYKNINDLLSPILPAKRMLAASRVFRNSKEYIVGTHMKSKPPGDHRDWFFKTINEDIKGNYFEHWDLINDDDEWELRLAYLNFFFQNDNILSLHCDPADKKDSIHLKYKKSPHIHIKDKYEIFSGAHIGLYMNNVDDVLLSLKNLEKSLKIGILMLKEQFLVYKD